MTDFRPEELAQLLYNSLAADGNVRVVGDRVQVRDTNSTWVDVPEGSPEVQNERVILNRRVRPSGGVSLTWCMAWIHVVQDEYFGQGLGTFDRIELLFKSKTTTTPLTLLQGFSNNAPPFNPQYNRFARPTLFSASIAGPNAFVVEAGYSRFYYVLVAEDFAGPIYSIREEIHNVGYLIQGEQVSLLRDISYTIGGEPEPPPPDPDTSTGFFRYLTSTIYDSGVIELPGGIFIPENDFVPRAYHGNFTRFNLIYPEPPYPQPPEGKGWKEILFQQDTFLNNKIYNYAIALNDSHLLSLRSLDGNDFYYLVVAPSDLDYMEQNWQKKYGPGATIRRLRFGVNAQDVETPPYTVAPNTPLTLESYLVPSLANIGATIDVEVYEQASLLGDRSGGESVPIFLDQTFARKLGKVSIPLTDEKLKSKVFRTVTQPVTGEVFDLPQLLHSYSIKVAAFQSR